MLQGNYDDLIWNNKNFPDKIDKDEDILLLCREDLIVLIYRGITLYLFFVLLLLTRLLLVGLNIFLLNLYDFGMWSMAMLMVVYFVISLHNYYLSLQIITTHRVIDIDQIGLFKREANTVPIKNIQDVSSKQSTFWQTVFNYGDIFVQSSGQPTTEGKGGSSSNGVFFNNVPNPKEIVSLLNKVQMALEDNHKSKEEIKNQAEALRMLIKQKIL